MIGALLLTVLPSAWTAPASAQSPSTSASEVADEVALTERTNAERTRRGIAPLSTHPQLTRLARQHSEMMAAEDDRGAGDCGDRRTLRHRADLAAGITAAWTVLRENVMCAGGDAARMHALLMGSAYHRGNLLATDVNTIGVGAARAADGTMWLTQIFMAGGTTPAATPVLEGVRAARAAFGTQPPEYVVLSRSDVFADSLAGAALAAGRGPVLFTSAPGPSDADPPVDPRTRREIDRLLGGRGTVYLLGGPRAVSRGAEAELRQAGYRTVRLSGATRFETAARIAREMVTRFGRPSTIQIASASSWSDAVTGAAAAGRRGSPLVLSNHSDVPRATARFLAEHPGATRIVLGGPNAIADGVVSRMGASRVWGPSRDETAMAISDSLFDDAGDQIVVIHGYDTFGWASALAWSSFAARNAAPQVIVGDTVSPSVATWLQEKDGVTGATFATGVSPEVRTQVERLLDQ